MAGSKLHTETTHESELSDTRWAVISFERCEASGLTYDQAVAKRAELQKKRIAGLGIVTDEAAARIKG